MKVAYIISAYKYPEQLIRLVRRLHTGTAHFLVHVDKKTDNAVYRRMVLGLSDLTNVDFLKRHRCYWGGFGHVEATIEGINEILNRNLSFDYAVLLTGQDYPIKTNDEIQEFLWRNNGALFLEYFPLPSDQWQDGGLDRIERWHVRLLGRHLMFPNGHLLIRRTFPIGLRPFGGSSYWCLPRECIEYIYKFIKNNRIFVKFFRFVDVPDEIFFQTIVLNSPFRDDVVNDNLRYMYWKDPDFGNPEILRKRDFDEIAKSPKLFARKFDSTVDQDILDLIDREILYVPSR